MSDFGKFLYYAGILYIISIFTSFIASFGVLIVIFLALQQIRHVNQKLYNRLLDKFYSRLLVAQIIIVIGNIVVFVGLIKLILAGGFKGINYTTTTYVSTSGNSFSLPFYRKFLS